MSWREVAMTQFGVAAARRAETDVATERFRVDGDWRRIDGGAAARLDHRTTIDVADKVGRWHDVDPRRPYDAWRTFGKAFGFATWIVAVGMGWWAGGSRGRGPLGVLKDDPTRS